MSKVLLVAWREFKHTALTKAFIIAAVGVPVAVLGLMLVMKNLMKERLPPLAGTLAVVDSTGKLAEAIEFELKPQQIAQRRRSVWNDPQKLSPQDVKKAIEEPPPQIDVHLEPHEAQADIAALKDRVRRNDLIALAIIPAAAIDREPSITDNRFELYVASDSAPSHTSMFEDAISAAVVRTRVEKTGMNLDQARALVRDPWADIKRLGESGGETKESAEIKMMIPMAFMMLLWISTFTSGNYLLTSTIEEKSNKVMEVLLSAVSPFQLMAGKILGQAGVSFIMLAMYAGMGLAAMAALAMMDLIPPILLIYLAIYFFMAFFMIAAIMAGVGSAVSELREAQSLIMPAMLVMMVPLMLWFPIMNNPNGALATITSFIPPLIPFVMILRVTTSTEPIAAWQIIASIITGYAWMVVMIGMCAKIFRVGVLMYGKPPTPLELLKWVRYR